MSEATKNQRFLKTLLDTKYVKIVIDLKSWGLPLLVDWRHNGITRPYYIDFLCLHFEMGKDPYEEVKR